jgi:hypothetical protein
LLEQALQALVQAPDDAVLVRVHTGHVDADQVGLHAELLALPGLVRDLRGVQQRLRRDAPAVQTGAAELGLVDQRHREVQLRGAQSGRVSSAAGAEDNDVERSAVRLAHVNSRVVSLAKSPGPSCHLWSRSLHSGAQPDAVSKYPDGNRA